MKKYYYVEMMNYEFGKIYGGIQEYYLIKKGWIKCEDYRENVNDDYYGVLTRKDICLPKGLFPNPVMFETLLEAKERAKKNLSEFYMKECEKLRNAHNDLNKEIEEMK